MALPTAEDNLNAMMYALDRLKRERCLEMSNQPNSGIAYIPNDDHRLYPCHTGLTNCEHGNCRVVTKTKCDSISQLPFDPITGETIERTKCETNQDCLQNFICDSKTKKCTPKNPYLEFRDGKCVYGNFALIKWCEFPSQRRLEPEAGVTNVPPFQYDRTTGKCNITKEYCDWMRTSYRLNEDGNPTCYSTTGQKIGEFFLGKTIFRGLKKGDGDSISKDFAGEDVSLYLSKNGKLSFNIDEVKKAFPELVVENKYIKFTPKDLKNPSKKRLFFILRHSDTISPTIIKTIDKHIR